VDAGPRGHPDTVESALDLIEPGHHRAGIAWLALRHPIGKDKTWGRFRHHAGLSPKLSRAMALPFENGGNGGIVGLDECTVAALLAVREPPRWRAAVLLARHGHVQRTGQTLTVGGLQVGGVVKEWLRLQATGLEGLAKGEELSCSWAHQGHEDTALPPALAATTTPDLLPRLWEIGGLEPEAAGPAAASLGDIFAERKGLFAPSPAWWRQ
jgi:hypothetical protein